MLFVLFNFKRMIRVKSIPKKNPTEPEAAPRFYASVIRGAKVDLDGLAITVANRCSLRRADVHGVLIALMDIIPDELAEGKIVSLGKIGSLFVNVKSEGADTKEDFTPGLVNKMHVRYRPTKELRKKLGIIDVSVTE